MVKIQRKISNNRNHYNGTNKRLKITVHQTGNTSRGANAEMHARFINNGASETWHYTVDDKQAIQHFEHNTQCWHAGDGRGNGNLHSIGVELCINSDGDYNKTVQNGAELVRHLMDTLNLGINDVVQHNHWSGKDCPKQIRAGKNGINWAKFKQMVQGNTNVSKPVKPSTNKPKPAPSKPSDNLYGAKLVKNEKAKYTVTAGNGIKVRNAPSTEAKHTGTLKKGESINYDQVYTGNGYRWLAYTGSTGNRLYLPYRPLNGKNEDWGYFGSAPTNKPKPKKKTLHLPKTAKTWRVYKPNGPYTTGNEIHLLTPSAYGGISYEIKGNPAPDVYLIDTKVKGRVAIYAGKGTGAVIK